MEQEVLDPAREHKGYTIIDVETTFTIDDRGKMNPSPFLPSNKLVSIGLYTQFGKIEYYAINHKEKVKQISYVRDRVQYVLDHSYILAGHNIKFDLLWLKECGYKYDGEVWDTMLFEYLKYNGIRKELDLSSCCSRYGIESKKSMDWKVNTDEIPWSELKEYGETDVEITRQLFLAQRNESGFEDDKPVLFSAL